MQTTTSTAGILFADVCGSVRLYERLGDDRALIRIDAALEFLSAIVTQHAGVVIKTIGDELLCAFPGAEQSVRAAIEMLDRHDQWPENQRDPIAFRIGLHSGEVLYRDGDVFGDAVNLAARIVGLAGDNQIITSSDTVDQLPTLLRNTCRLIGPIYIKGKQQPVSIYEVPWHNDNDATVLGAPLTNRDFGQLGLHLTLGDTHIVVDTDRPSASIGRSDDSDLVSPSPTASRHHLSIELRGDKFVLSDRSTNGTYLFNKLDDSRQRLLREQVVLIGEGWISPGQNQIDPAHAIHFQITGDSLHPSPGRTQGQGHGDKSR
jgi:class 3 adenylate cyclase